MDSVTQALLGAVTAQLGFRQRIGREATWVAAGAAVVPDLDVFVAPLVRLTGAEVDGLSHVVTHRGISHSLLAVPVMSAALAALWWWGRRRYAGVGRRTPEETGPPHPERMRPGWLLYGCVLVAMLTHPLLDWCTSYGTQLFAPLTSARYAIDCVPIVDVFFTPLLVVTLLACYVVRKVRGSVAARATLAIGWAGFALAVGYLGAGRVLHDRAVAMMRRAAPADERVVHAGAYPSLGTIFLWRGVIETDRAWHVARLRPLVDYGPAGPPLTTVAKEDGPWIARARALPEAERYAWFAMGRLRAGEERAGGRHVVELHDMRYGWPVGSVTSLWPLRVTFGADGSVERVERVRPERRGEGWAGVGEVWRDMWRR